jgi:hypothetical protein
MYFVVIYSIKKPWHCMCIYVIFGLLTVSDRVEHKIIIIISLFFTPEKVVISMTQNIKNENWLAQNIKWKLTCSEYQMKLSCSYALGVGWYECLGTSYSYSFISSPMTQNIKWSWLKVAGREWDDMSVLDRMGLSGRVRRSVMERSTSNHISSASTIGF